MADIKELPNQQPRQQNFGISTETIREVLGEKEIAFLILKEENKKLREEIVRLQNALSQKGS